MKRTLLTLALILPLTLSAGTEHKKPRLSGVWQQVQQDPESGRTMRLPVWKVLQSDGNFTIFLIANPAGQSILTNQGTYKSTSDSTYVEHVTGSITDTDLVGRDNTITYHFEGKDRMHVVYRKPSAAQEARETWVRVKLELPE